MKDERPVPAPKFKLVIENTIYEPRFVMHPQHGDERPVPAPKFKLVIENTIYEPRFVMHPQHGNAEAGGHQPTTPIGDQLKAYGNGATTSGHIRDSSEPSLGARETHVLAERGGKMESEMTLAQLFS